MFSETFLKILNKETFVPESFQWYHTSTIYHWTFLFELQLSTGKCELQENPLVPISSVWTCSLHLGHCPNLIQPGLASQLWHVGFEKVAPVPYWMPTLNPLMFSFSQVREHKDCSLSLRRSWAECWFIVQFGKSFFFSCLTQGHSIWHIFVF